MIGDTKKYGEIRPSFAISHFGEGYFIAVLLYSEILRYIGCS